MLVIDAGGAEAEPWLAASARALEGTAAEVVARTAPGSAADVILAAAREETADVIVLGATGATGLVRFLIGSTAERVLRHAEASVLIGRPVRYDLERVLVGVDPSGFAKRVVERATSLPIPPESVYQLATVLPLQGAIAGVAPMVWASLAGELQQIMDDAQKDAETRLREHARVLQSAGRNVKAEILRGDPTSALLGAAEKECADLVIVGSHGEGGVDRFLLGSVSEQVARHAQCSVLVVR
ncbi:MAG TPA: universal stress protein [Armatimonadota bacterium]|nr:universal stress protein [Armatimonadota bacterium]